MENRRLISDLFGFSRQIPLDEKQMAKTLKVTFAPPHQRSGQLDEFMDFLKSAFQEHGVQVIPFEQAKQPGSDRVRPGIVIFDQGEGDEDQLAVHRVSGLYQNTIAAVYEGPPPFPEQAGLQETLDGIVGILAWNMVHVPIFVEEDQWTFCTMNGAMVRCRTGRHFSEDVLQKLIPKLSASVIPPRRENIVYREGVLDPVKSGYQSYIDDFMESARIWRENGLMIAHTSLEQLKFRNESFRRIVSRFLDHRTGMSYGFMVRQLPVEVGPAMRWDEAPAPVQQALDSERTILEKDDNLYVRIDILGESWIINLPDIWVLATRSGCEKTNLNPDKDILRLGLHRGKITIETPEGISSTDARPSYDTYAILAHSIGNVAMASVIKAIGHQTDFPEKLKANGLSICHWHDYPPKDSSPSGYFVHGDENPPVACSSPQSAIYALCGKLNAFEQKLDSMEDIDGDVHIEPCHGTNMTGTLSLAETAAWVDEVHEEVKAGK